ncbi:MAG: M28 family peptidase, partial [Planctomycetia bacterium]
MSGWQRMDRALVAAALVAAWLPVAVRAEQPPEFSGQRAFIHLEAIAALGPRPSGSAAMAKQRELLAAHFRAAGGTVRGQAFEIRDRRTGRPVHMENLVVEWHPDRRDRVLVGAHYDTRPFPDRDPVDPKGTFIGANDGASGVALLMELARAMPSVPGPVGVDFVLFDAEEYVVAARDPYFLGSTFFARQYAADQQAGRLPYRYRCGVIVDMVADRDLEIWQEQQSVNWPDTSPVVDSIWAVAARRKVRQFVPRPKYSVEDDHVPLRMIGKIPTCDIIDFDYPHWHTTQDTPRQCAAESLEVVGGVLLEWLRGDWLRGQP